MNYSLISGKGIDSLSYSCKISEGYTEFGNDCIYLTNITWAVGSSEENEIKISDDCESFTHLTALVFRVVSKTRKLWKCFLKKCIFKSS